MKEKGGNLFYLIFSFLTILTLIIATMVIVHWLSPVASHSQIDTDNKSSYDMPDDATLINSEMNRADVQLPQAPAWTNVHRANEFWIAIHNQPKNLVFFSTEGCSWCRAAKNWWNANGSINGWQFVEWNFMNNDSDEAWQEFSKTLRDIYLSKNPKNSRIGFPTCAAIVNAQPNLPLTQSVKITFLGFNKCTAQLKLFTQSDE